MSTHPAVRGSAYDVMRVREEFPALAIRVYGKPLVYLDNAASAQKPRAVLDRLMRAYTSEYANVHRGLHYLANVATEAYEGARTKVAQFVNARRSEEIIFTRNATEAINLVASSYGQPNIGNGDEIVLSVMEHHSNIVPWHFLRERHGAVIKWAPVDDDGNFLIEEFEKLLTPRTKLVAITHMSNALGTPSCRLRMWSSWRTFAASKCWSTVRRAPCTCRRTCRTSVAISTSSPVTSSTGRPGSVCSTAGMSCLLRCGPSMAGAR